MDRTPPTFTEQLHATLAGGDDHQLARLMEAVCQTIEPGEYGLISQTVRNRIQLWQGCNDRARMITVAMCGALAERADAVSKGAVNVSESW